MLKIVSELKMVNVSHQQALGAKEGTIKQSHISFDDLSKAMEEFDMVLRRPQFIEEKMLPGA